MWYTIHDKTSVVTIKHRSKFDFEFVEVVDEQPARMRLRGVEELLRVVDAGVQRLRQLGRARLHLRLRRERAHHAEPAPPRTHISYNTGNICWSEIYIKTTESV